MLGSIGVLGPADLLGWIHSSPETMFGADFGDFEEWQAIWTLRLTDNRSILSSETGLFTSIVSDW